MGRRPEQTPTEEPSSTDPGTAPADAAAPKDGAAAAAPSQGAGGASCEGDSPEDLRKKAEERDSFLEELRRARADLDNLQKRVRRERPAWEEQAVGRFVRQLLPVVDGFERALGSASADGPGSAGVEEGVRMIHRMFLRLLEESGIEEIPATGRFDPELHEAVLQEPVADRPTGEITGVLEKGYRYRGLILRPAKVKVAVNVAESPAESAASLDGSEPVSSPEEEAQDLGEE
jgi:molecular chaperone GrpE